jgi:hypothetical protein
MSVPKTVMRAFVDVAMGERWVTIAQWVLGPVDADDLYDAISQLEEWPPEDERGGGPSGLLDEEPLRRLTYCSACEVLDIWPLDDETDAVRRAFLSALDDLSESFAEEEVHVLFYCDPRVPVVVHDLTGEVQ